MDEKRFSLYGNTITPAQDRKALAWQNMFVKQFNYDPDETYDLSVKDNAYLGTELGIRDIVRDGDGEQIDPETQVIISTIRMGFGHYRIAYGRRLCSARHGLHSAVARSARYPGGDLGRHQLVEHQLQQVLADLATFQAVQQVRVGVGDVGRSDTPRSELGSQQLCDRVAVAVPQGECS